MLLNQGGHSGQEPEFISKAMIMGVLAQQFGEPLQLFRAQSGLTAAGMGFRVKSMVGVLGRASRHLRMELG